MVKSGYFNELTARGLANFAQVCMVIFTPLCAMVSQRQQGSHLMQLGLVASILTAPLLFLASIHHSLSATISAEIFYGLCLGLVGSVMFKHLSDLFPPAVRYSGPAVAWSLGPEVVTRRSVNSELLRSLPQKNKSCPQPTELNNGCCILQ